MRLLENKKKIWMAFLYILFLSFIMYFAFGMLINYEVKAPLSNLPKVVPHRRILVFAPHCDDETLGTGGVIAKAIKSGDDVRVVMMTNGDGFVQAVDVNFNTLRPSPREFLKFAGERQQETLAALKVLGVTSDKVIFLGYPDGGLAYLWLEFFSGNKNFVSYYTQTDRVPYANAFRPNALYKGEILLDIVKEIITTYKPTDIFFPHPSDHHPDHWATNAFVKLALEQTGYKANEYLYLVHFGEWPVPWAKMPGKGLFPPSSLLKTGTDWRRFSLANGLEHQKAQALERYKSQMAVMRSFLVSFIRTNELFGIYPDVVQSKEPQKTTIIDAVGDTVTKEISRGADITAVKLVDKGKELSFQIYYRARPLDVFTYGLRMKIIDKASHICDLEIQIAHEKLQIINTPGNCIANSKVIKLKRLANGWEIYIPKKYLPSADVYFISTDSSFGSLNVDKTAWRAFKIQ